MPATNESALGEELVQVIAHGKPNSTEEVDRLIRAGAPVNYSAGSDTPLNLAAYNNDLEAVQLLESIRRCNPTVLAFLRSQTPMQLQPSTVAEGRRH